MSLKQRNLEVLDRLFWAVSTPGNPDYQKYMTVKQIQDIVAPDAKDHAVVMNWLKSAGSVQVKDMRDAIEVRCTVHTASMLFDTDFYSFRNEATGRVIYNAWGAVRVPTEVHRRINFVEGVSSFPVPHLKPKVYVPEQTLGIVPESITTIYKIPAQTSGGAPQTSVGVIEFQAQNYAPSDLAAFATNVGITISPVTAAHTVGPNDPTNPQLEASLDIEMVASVDPAAEAWFWLEDGQGWLYQFVQHFATVEDVPQVASISYGWSESNQCDIDPNECQSLGVDSYGYVDAVNTGFQKIALRGITILVASGDSGANGRTDPSCTLNYLKPDYPAACPFITSVGATQLNNPVTNLPNPPPICQGQGYDCASGGQEVAVSFDVASFASGGGFSNRSSAPTYQQAAIAAYFASTSITFPPAGYYNTMGRGYPDVAAFGTAILIYQGGIQSVGGTSASAPTWAAVVAILNQYAIKKTGKPLGFLNPWIYQVAANCPSCFTDITIGDNICTENGCASTCEGFYCTTGWDPVTGWGSPNTQALINYINTHM